MPYGCDGWTDMTGGCWEDYDEYYCSWSYASWCWYDDDEMT